MTLTPYTFNNRIIQFNTLQIHSPGSTKTEAPDEEEWDDMPKVKEVAEGPYYDQFEYNITRNYTVIAGTPAEILCRIKLKTTDGNKTVRFSYIILRSVS